MSLVARYAQWLRRHHPLIEIVLPWPSQLALVAAMVWALIPWTWDPVDVAVWLGLERWPVWVPATIALTVASVGVWRSRVAKWSSQRRRLAGTCGLVGVLTACSVAGTSAWPVAAAALRSAESAAVDAANCSLNAPAQPTYIAANGREYWWPWVSALDRADHDVRLRLELPYVTAQCAFGFEQVHRSRWVPPPPDASLRRIGPFQVPSGVSTATPLESVFTRGERLRRAGALESTTVRAPDPIPATPVVPVLACFAAMLAVVSSVRSTRHVPVWEGVRLIAWCTALAALVISANVVATRPGGQPWMAALIRATLLSVTWVVVIRWVRRPGFVPALAVVWPTCAVLTVLGLWFVLGTTDPTSASPARHAVYVTWSVCASLVTAVVSQALAMKEPE